MSSAPVQLWRRLLAPAEAAEIIVPHHEGQAGAAVARAAHDGAHPAAGQPPGQPG